MQTFLKNRDGNFGIMTALLMVPLIGAAGVAIDTANALGVRMSLQAAADAAALAAVGDQSAGFREAMHKMTDGRLSSAIDDAKAIFDSQISQSENYTLLNSEADVVKSGHELKAVFTYEARVKTTLSSVLGVSGVTISGTASAVFQTETFRDFYLLLDNTPSMGVGATPADVSTMVANTKDKCAFACHIVKNGVEDKNSYYHLAKRLGVTIRIDVVAKATEALMTTAIRERKSSNQYRMAVYTFGERAEDTKLFEVAKLTSELNDIRKKASKIGLMSIPWQNFDNDQQTDFDRALSSISAIMGPAGTGASAASPEKIVYFVSDGVGNSYKPADCTKPTTGGRCQEPIDVRGCTALKNKGYRVAVLYTTYLPLPTNGWYNKWIGPFQNEISTRMQECASPGLFFEVNPNEGIADAMNALFLKIVNSPRLAS